MAQVKFNLHPSQIKAVIAAKVGRLVESFHLAGQHDQSSHGSWSDGSVGDEPDNGVMKMSDAQIANDKKVMQARISKNKNDAESKARLRDLSAEQRRREAAASATSTPVEKPSAPTGAVNKQGVKPSKENGYPSRYDGNPNLRATVHAAVDRAGDIGLAGELTRVEANGKSVLENIILNGEVVLYKPSRTVEKTDKRSGKKYMATENPVYTFNMPGHDFQLAVALDPDRGQIRSIFPTSPAQEVKIAAWKKQCGPCWQEKNRADIKAQVLAKRG